MKKYFITGLVILLPAALTIAIVVFIFNFLTQPFLDIVRSILAHYGLKGKGFLFLSAEQISQYLSQILILITLFLFTLLLGAFARWFFIHYLLRIGEYFLHKIPFINAVYKTCKDVINTIFTSKTKAFKQVVLVPFPNPDTYSIGLLTADTLPSFEDSENWVAVFVPTTPNPTSGYLLMLKDEEVIHLEMKVEEALKYVISCGVIQSPFNPIPKGEESKPPKKKTKTSKQ